MAEVEVLMQPKTAAGLPRGATVAVFRQTVSLRPTANRQQAVGRCWLPRGFSSQRARDYYYRVISRVVESIG